MRSEEFDNRVKRMLDQREIVPSSSAWENLSDQLDQSEMNPGIRPLYRYIAAAVVAIMLIVGGGYLLIPDAENYRQVAGEEEVPADDHRPAEKLFDLPGSLDSRVLSDQGAEVAARTSDLDRVLSRSGQQVAAEIPSQVKEVKIVSSLTPQTKLHPMSPLKDAEKVDVVTDEEIDALLAQARASLAQEQDSSVMSSVSATALLEDVEEELDQNFKDKALETLKKGVVKLRAAVAQGNQ